VGGIWKRTWTKEPAHIIQTEQNIQLCRNFLAGCFRHHEMSERVQCGALWIFQTVNTTWHCLVIIMWAFWQTKYFLKKWVAWMFRNSVLACVCVCVCVGV
jgi:hypothetical protein